MHIPLVRINITMMCDMYTSIYIVLQVHEPTFKHRGRSVHTINCKVSKNKKYQNTLYIRTELDAK